MEYASGVLPTAPGLVVAAHAEVCATCRGALQAFEEMAGAMLQAADNAPLAPTALSETLKRLDAPAPAVVSPPRPSLPGLPGAIAAAGVGMRRWFGPGRWVAPIKAPRTDNWRVFLIRGPANAKMPFHGHSGPELTCVLGGAFHDGPDLFQQGDFVETDPSRDHYLQVTGEGPCLSVIACRGPMRGGLITYLATRFFGV